MTEPQTWRELLGTIIENVQERQRIASQLGVNSITLTRWANNEAHPRSRNLQLLLQAIPEQHMSRFTELLRKEYNNLHEVQAVKEVEAGKIPSRFYTSILQAYTKTAPNLRFWSIGKLVIQQVLQQLDPYRTGFIASIIGCNTPPNGEKVRSLRIRLGQGTGIWQGTWDRVPYFIGIETLSGYVVSSRHPTTIQDIHAQQTYYPMFRQESSRSLSVIPIQKAEGIAGCLYLCSTQANYFQPHRVELLQDYAELLSLAFVNEEYYPPEQIEMGVLPSLEEQEPYFLNFQQRLVHVIRESAQQKIHLNNQQATQKVLQQLEYELLHLIVDRQENN